MGNNNIDALYRMVASAVQNKTQQEERTLLSALQNIDHYGEMAAARLSKKRLHTDFGVEYEMPENWKRLKNRHPDSVMFYADCDMEEEQEKIASKNIKRNVRKEKIKKQSMRISKNEED